MGDRRDVGAGPMQDNEGGEKGRGSAASKLIRLGENWECFSAQDHKPYITLPIGDHRETHSAKSPVFRRLVRGLFFNNFKQLLSEHALSEAIGHFEGRALFEGRTAEVFTRVGTYDGEIYIDLGGPKWDAVAITREGWHVHQAPPVKFKRTRGLLALPQPVLQEGSLRSVINNLLNVAAEEDRHLLLAWLIGAMRPKGPFPVLVLNSEQGSGKTTAAKILRRLIDPNEAPLRSVPRSEHDLVIAASNGWIIGLDNLSHVPEWLSDAICRLSTGGGFGTRELYTDENEVLFSGQRPVILNGIEEIVTRGDLMDRCIMVSLPAISDQRRRSEAELWAEFDRLQPGAMAELFDSVAAALANLRYTKLPALPRMADFVIWATAAEPALEMEDGTVYRAYALNREDANQVTIDASPIARRLLALETWAGSATDLLTDLTNTATEVERRSRSWPTSARSLSQAIRRLVPSLRSAGVAVEFDRENGGNRERIIRLRKSGSNIT